MRIAPLFRCAAPLLVPVALGAQVVRGTLTDTSGTPIPGAEVRLVSYDGNAIVAAATPSPRGTFTIAAPSLASRAQVLVFEACADGRAPQNIFAPFTRTDTLHLVVQLAPAKSRGHAPLGPGKCATQIDDVQRIQVRPAENFATMAVATTLRMDARAERAKADSSARDRRVDSVSRALESALGRARSSDERARLAYELLAFWFSLNREPTAKSLTAVRAALPPTSRWWMLAGGNVQGVGLWLFYGATDTSSTPHVVANRRAAQAYFETMRTSISEPATRNGTDYALVVLARVARDSARMMSILARMLDQQPDYPFSRFAASRYSITSALRRGAPMPPIDFAALPDTTAPRITNATLQGRKLTLVNFWGTWCGPCIGELPVLSRVYAKYHPRGLEMISIAADESPEIVNAFRREKNAMPWINAYGGATDAPAFRRLGILEFPRTVLVDGNGVIIASEGVVNEAMLVSLIERALLR